MNESIQIWLDALTADPAKAVHDLVMGRSRVPAWSRANLRDVLVDVNHTHAEALDTGLAQWFRDNLMKLPPDRVPGDVWASFVQEVFRGITGLPLPQVAQVMRDRMRDFRQWLHPLRHDQSLDPEAAYLVALAWAKTNKHLEGLWRALALRIERNPFYYTDIGLLGLRKARDEDGNLPPKAPQLLLTTLIDLADVPGSSRDAWKLTVSAILGGYSYTNDTAIREFAPVLAGRPSAKNGPKWLAELLPTKKRSPRQQPTTVFSPFPEECAYFLGAIEDRGLKVDGLDKFLARHRAYADATGEAKYLSIAFGRLAEVASGIDPTWAIDRVEEALAWDKSDTHNWSVLARCFWARAIRAHKDGNARQADEDANEAIDILWFARRRFPYDSFKRGELAEMYRRVGDSAMAESIYREAIDDFPANAACRCGLAEVLIGREAFAEAEAVFKDAMREIPDAPDSCDALAAMWVRLGRIDEAELLYRDSCERFPRDVFCRTGLAELLFLKSTKSGDTAQREEAKRFLQEAVDLGDHFALNRLSEFDERWEYLRRAGEAPHAHNAPAEELFPVSRPDVASMRPAQRLGRAMVLQWQARQKCASPEERERCFREAEALLNVRKELTGDCWEAYVEARGFLLLAREQNEAARDYFQQQLAELQNAELPKADASKNKKPPLGLRLGLAEARARLGEELDADGAKDFAEFGREGTMLPLVMRVLALLASEGSDPDLHALLLEIYPEVRNLTDFPDSAKGSSASMARTVMENVFLPADIRKVSDLESREALPRVRERFQARRDAIFSVFEKFALSCA